MKFIAMPHCPVHDSTHEGAVQGNPKEPSQGFLPLSSIETRKELLKRQSALIAKAAAAGLAIKNKRKPLMPSTLSSLRLLGESQKVVKGLKKGVVTAILYLSPDTEAFSGVHKKGKTICPWASVECSAACLGHESGQMGMPDAKNARLWRTVILTQDRRLFDRMLDEEITDFEQRVHEKAPGFIPAVRLDGTSDLGLAEKFALKHPNVQFYDYTKSPERMRRFLNGGYPSNWHLTFSYSGHNEKDAVEILRAGGNVAVVFGVQPTKQHVVAGPLPCSWHGFAVEDADATDIRFQDCAGRVSGLRVKYKKGKLRDAVASGKPFVQPMPEDWEVGSKVKHGWPGAIAAEAAGGRRLPVRANPGNLLAIVGNSRHFTPCVAAAERVLQARTTQQRHAAMGAFAKAIAKAANESGARLSVIANAAMKVALKDPRQDLVAGAGSGGRVKSSRARSAKTTSKTSKASKGTRRVKNNRTTNSQEVAPEKKRRFTLDEARGRFEGFDAANAVIEEFHGSHPDHVELFAIDDGKKEITVDRVHAALHRTIETNYMVPWENSNKHGTLWKHEHKEGKGLKGLERGKTLPNPEDLPLEIYDPATKTTRKIGGKFQVKDWWYD